MFSNILSINHRGWYFQQESFQRGLKLSRARFRRFGGSRKFQERVCRWTDECLSERLLVENMHIIQPSYLIVKYKNWQSLQSSAKIKCRGRAVLPYAASFSCCTLAVSNLSHPSQSAKRKMPCATRMHSGATRDTNVKSVKNKRRDKKNGIACEGICCAALPPLRSAISFVCRASDSTSDIFSSPATGRPVSVAICSRPACRNNACATCSWRASKSKPRASAFIPGAACGRACSDASCPLRFSRLRRNSSTVTSPSESEAKLGFTTLAALKITTVISSPIRKRGTSSSHDASCKKTK